MAELLLALVLGFKHGLDPDHLAIIDNLARLVRQHAPRTARFAGLLFSLGHSLAVCLFTLSIVLLSRSMALKVPAWLESSGVAISATALILLALMNLHSLRVSSLKVTSLRAPAHSNPRSSRLQASLGYFKGRSAALGIAVLGGMFALSFDTLTQAALFSGLAQTHQNPLYATTLSALILSAAFGLGMIFADTINGLFVNKLLDHLSATPEIGRHFFQTTTLGAKSKFKRSIGASLDGQQTRAKAQALRFMTISLSLLSLVVAGLALSKLIAQTAPLAHSAQTYIPSLKGYELALSSAAIIWVLLSYVIAASIALYVGRAAATN
jgi:nickel/cobalt transporter (NiCoT) family protein